MKITDLQESISSGTGLGRQAWEPLLYQSPPPPGGTKLTLHRAKKRQKNERNSY
uniref:Uncharacterized protein n=1 Tax=Anguilla anguilla TaxID=7936 RepID=A0A0E9QP66_ANGAN